MFRYPWVVVKLVLIVTVIVVGATVLRPVLDDDSTGGDAALIAGAAYDVAALTAANGARGLQTWTSPNPRRHVRSQPWTHHSTRGRSHIVRTAPFCCTATTGRATSCGPVRYEFE